MNRTGYLQAVMAEKELSASNVATITGVTEADVNIWLDESEFVIPKDMLCKLYSFGELQAKHKLSDEEVAAMAGMPVEYVNIWAAGQLPVPVGIMLKLIRRGE